MRELEHHRTSTPVDREISVARSRGIDRQLHWSTATLVLSMIPRKHDSDGGLCSLWSMALDQVCFGLASADAAATAALFARFTTPSSGGARTNAANVALKSDSGTNANSNTNPSTCNASGGGEAIGFGIPSVVGDAILKRAGEIGCLTNDGILQLLRWCTPLAVPLEEAPLTVTDSLLLRYPEESCAALEDVRISWSPHLHQVESLLLKIRKAGVDGQEDEDCALRHLDVSGNNELTDGILKALAGRCPALSTLIVDACPSITGSFLQRLATGCPALAKLSIDGTTGIDDAAMSNFVMDSKAVASGSLQSLHLGGCPMGALTVQALGMRGACLRDLNLDGCSALGDAAVRMVCRACPRLSDLSLLECSALTCRGAWQCTQHPSVETLSITLSLFPGPDYIPPEKKSANVRRNGTGVGRRRRADAVGRGESGARGFGAESTRGIDAGTTGEGRGGNGGGGGGRGNRVGQPTELVETWACERCTCSNGERRSTCEACRAPQSSDTSPPPPPSAPQASRTDSLPASLPSSPARSASPASSVCPGGTASRRNRCHARRGERGGSQERSSQSPSSSLETLPLNLPAVSPSSRLRRLRLQLAAVPREVVAVATAAAAAADDSGSRSEEANRTEAGTIGSDFREGVEFPVRRLTPLLPPRLHALEIWSCNAPPPPLPPSTTSPSPPASRRSSPSPSRAMGRPPGNSTSPRRASSPTAGEGARWASHAGGIGERSGGRGGGQDWRRRKLRRGGVYGSSGSGSGCGVWRTGETDFGDGHDEACATSERANMKGGGRGSREGSHSTGEEGLGSGGNLGIGVAVGTGPGDLIGIVQACPRLRELTLCGDPNRKGPVSHGVRIRGRGPDAHKTTVAAGIHATAAAVAFFLRGSSSGGGDGSGDFVEGTVEEQAGSGGRERDARRVGNSPTRRQSPPLRALTIVDCPSLPPLAVLEAIGVEGGARLEHVVVGSTYPVKTPAAAAAAAAAEAVVGLRRTARQREGNLRAIREARTVDAAGVRHQRDVVDDVDGSGQAGGARGGSHRGGGTGGWEGEGRVTVASESLTGLYVAGEGALTGVVLRCPRLERLELVRCAGLRDAEVVATPTLAHVRLEHCMVKDEAIAALTKACWRLETLSLDGSSSIGDKALVSALVECPHLRSLKTYGCRAVGGVEGSNDSVYSGSVKKETGTSFLLNFLRAPTCVWSGDSPPDPAPPLLRLQELTLAWCSAFTGAHFAALANALPFLRRLSISHCRGFVELTLLTDGGPMHDVVIDDVSDSGSLGRSRDVLEIGKGISAGEEVVGLEEEQEQEEQELRVDKACIRKMGSDDEDDEGEHTADESATDPEGTDTDEGKGDKVGLKELHHQEREDQEEEAEEEAGEGDKEEHQVEMAPADKERAPAGRRQGISKGESKGGRRRRKEPAMENVSYERNCEDGSKSQRRGRGGGGGGGGGGKGRRKAGRSDRNEDAEAVEPRSKLDRKAGRKKGSSLPGRRGTPRAVSDGDVMDRADRKCAETAGVARREKILASGQGAESHDLDGEEDDVFQGMEFKVDGKTRAKLERLAAALPREPGKKNAGRPSCIRFLQDKCPHSAADCTWAHIAMHPPKTLRFKPLIANAHEAPSKKPPARQRATPPSQLERPLEHGRPPASASSLATHIAEEAGLTGLASGREKCGDSHGGVDLNAAAAEVTTATFMTSGVGAGAADGDIAAPVVCFPSLQFLTIQACPALKKLETLRCPALAVASVTSCRELTSLSLECPALSQLDLTGCVRLESWDFTHAGDRGSFSALQVAALNYCKALDPRFLARLVEQARHLHRLEIYGAGIVTTSKSHSGSSRSKNVRDHSRVAQNRLQAKAAAILKGLDKGRPNLTVIRTKKDFTKER